MSNGQRPAEEVSMPIRLVCHGRFWQTVPAAIGMEVRVYLETDRDTGRGGYRAGYVVGLTSEYVRVSLTSSPGVVVERWPAQVLAHSCSPAVQGR